MPLRGISDSVSSSGSGSSWNGLHTLRIFPNTGAHHLTSQDPRPLIGNIKQNPLVGVGASPGGSSGKNVLSVAQGAVGSNIC